MSSVKNGTQSTCASAGTNHSASESKANDSMISIALNADVVVNAVPVVPLRICSTRLRVFQIDRPSS